MQTQTGLENLLNNSNLSTKIKGNVALLMHSASVDSSLKLAPFGITKLFGNRLKALFGPQHGIITDVQDNMVESKNSIHPYFQLLVHSLYSETRSPTAEMLKGIDTVIVDLQDVGTRIYTYIYTLTLLMKECAKKNIKVVVLDRPNPINGLDIEGNILDENWTSFVGLHPIPVRHALTIGEVAIMANKYWKHDCDLEVIPMKNWKRSMSFEETKLPWVLPSPNLPTIEAAYTFVGTVLFEGANISEGRGTTRSLEIVGHPKISPFDLIEKMETELKEYQLEGFILRPLYFMPTFQKHAGKSTGGFQIHVTDRAKFKPWRLCQYLLKTFYHTLGDDFEWKQPPYEYVYDKNPMDIINGTDKLRKWVENNGSYDDLKNIESNDLDKYMDMRENCLIYS